MATGNSYGLTSVWHLADAVIHQATGVLMVRGGTSIDEAAVALCDAAEATGLDVTAVAANIVSSTQRR
jgi:AmiR/NasT family two-component response regulator